MFAQRIVDSFKRNKTQRRNPNKAGIDLMTEQVRKMFATSDQKLILMVRG